MSTPVTTPPNKSTANNPKPARTPSKVWFKDTRVQLAAVFIVALVALGVVHTFGATSRVDLTEHELYTLSSGTQSLVNSIERPVTLKLFFSEEGTQEIVRLRHYAKRVAELIAEVQAMNPETITFEQINPEPFSEKEDEASRYGLTSAPVAPGQSIYFGLVAVPSVVADNPDMDLGLSDDESVEVISFLQPDREAFLEYDVAQLIHKVGNPEKPVLGVLSGLEINGGFDVLARQPKQPWMSIQQMQSLYDVKTIGPTETQLPAGLDVLVLIQPKAPSDELLYAIDQFALNGGRVLAFIDPLANADRPNPMTGGERINGADWNRLFHAWGVELNPGQVVGDMNLALMVNQGQGEAPKRHVAIQSYPESNIVRTPFTSQINQLNLATVGEWRAWPQPQSEKKASEKKVKDNAKVHTTIEPLIITSDNSGLLNARLFEDDSDLNVINNEFKGDQQVRNVAVMIGGQALSAFPDGPPPTAKKDDDKKLAAGDVASETEGEIITPKTDAPTAQATANQADKQQPHVKTGEINAILVADADMLTDYLWVQVMGQFRGQSIAQPFADNGDFLLNALEHLSGNKALMSIRSRGTYSKPFTRVEEIRLAAEQRFQEQEQQLNVELEATEAKLAELQPNDDALELTPEQQQALLAFQKERLNIRKSLRDVNLQLNKDIRALGLRVKAVNIFLVPGLLFIFAIVFFSIRQKHMDRAKLQFSKA